MAMRTRRALSLIEVVLSIVILGLAVPPLMIQLGGAIRTQVISAVHLNLAQLASEQLAEVFADHADPTRGYAYITAANYPTETDPAGFKGYTRVTTIREVDPDDGISPQAGSGLKRLVITVTGPDDQSARVESFVTDVFAGGSGPGATSTAGGGKGPQGKGPQGQGPQGQGPQGQGPQGQGPQGQGPQGQGPQGQGPQGQGPQGQGKSGGGK